MRIIKNCARNVLVILLSLFLLGSCQKQNVVSLRSLLLEMSDRHAITYFPNPDYMIEQFSSYDRRSVSPDEEGWYANADYTQFIRTEENNGRKEYVLFDHEGPGAIVRWWMTFAGEGSYDGTLRIYIDDNDQPVIEDNVLKVISGQLLAGEPLSSSVSPETKYEQRGHNLYLPVPYGEHCKITYECDVIINDNGRMRPSIYYNITYRDYNENAIVESFTMDELDANLTLIRDLNNKLSGFESPSEMELSGEGIVEPGKSTDLRFNGRRHAINQISIKLEAEEMKQALRSTVLSASFDGTQTVWAPVGEFFGTGFDIHSSNTWYSNVSDNGEMNCFWIMPFRSDVKVSLINYGDQEVSSEMHVGMQEYKWTDRSMYFGSLWHEYNKIKTAGSENVGGTGKHYDINYIDIEGQGVYAGDAVTVFNTADAWWGEGDEKIFVNDESFPSCIGTGTEDYYGYAWCRPESFTHPFIAQPTGAGNFHPGMTVNMRYRVLDAIPFTEGISSNIELWHWAPTVMNYALTSYWYVSPGFSTNINPDINLVTIKVPYKRSDVIIPVLNEEGIIEGEFMEVLQIDGGSAETQFTTTWDWSNKGQLWWRNASEGDNLDLRFISEAEFMSNVELGLSKAVDYGIISFRINGKPSSIRFNGYTNGEMVTNIDLGLFQINEGDNVLSITVEGSDRRAKQGNMAGVDYLKIGTSGNQQ
ncbi:MAG TPA: glycoside hydrolase family 172 protein [Bacteroidales bacterium]|nr:glycoside hydrolase family 172 protein [Bacteroidales bacterium]